jgi:iron complex outermembrane receptor protein
MKRDMTKSRHSLRRNRTWYGTRAGAGLATLLAAASSSWAQGGPPGAAPEPEAEVDVAVPGEGDGEPEGEVIIVTGSRIRTDPLDKQAPVLQLTREELERTGLTSVGDILQQLPGSGGAINGKFNSSGNFGFPPDGGGIGAGAVEADLRYLGSKRVLVLVDGVRWVNGSSASGVSAATDLNTIPLAIIERIEVLEDGASPIYGSDAISGVINIITRKSFEGVSANAYTGGYHYGDGLVQKYDVSYGSSNDKMSVVVSASYLDQRLVSSGDRDISDTATPNVDECDSSCSSATPQGRFRFVDPATGAPQDLTLNVGTAGLASYPSDFNAFDVEDRFNFAPYNLLLTPSKRLSMFSSVTYELADRLSFHGKASFTNRESLNQAAPEPLFIGPEAGTGSRLDRIAIDVSNPYNPFGFTFDPATNPFVITRRPLEAGPRRFEQVVNTFYVSGGLGGDLDIGKQRFYWDTTVAYGVNRADQLRPNSFNSIKLEQALGPAYMDGAGDWRCGTASDPGDLNCVPFNLFGGQGANGEGTITPAMLDYVTFVQHDVSEQTLVDVLANVAGNLVDLPTGALSMAAGVEHRRLAGFFEPDPVDAAGDSAGTPVQPTAGDYWVNEAYAELRAPLIVRMPAAELFDVNGAVRVSDYSFTTPEFTGKVGARWKPIADLMLRGSYARGFRGPGIGELYGSEASYAAVMIDPCSGFNAPTVPAAVRQRCIDLGLPADGSYEQLNPQIGVTTGGNRNLVPETSDSFNLSLAYSPSWLEASPWVDSFDLELAYYDIRIDKAIAPMDAQFQIDGCVLGEDDTLCEGILRTPQGTIYEFGNTLENLGGIETRGIDVALTYLMPATELGRFRFTSLSSYLIDFWEKVPVFGGFDALKREGLVIGAPERAFPKLKSSLAIDWFYDQIRATLVTRYIHSAMEQCRTLSDYPGLCSHPNMGNDALSRNKLGAQVYNDVQVTWTPPQFDNALNITAGVNNLFNNDPPDCYSCVLNGFNPTTYDVPGIFGYLTASYRMY